MLCLTIGVDLLALARNQLALRWPGYAANIEFVGYALLLMAGLAAARSAGLGARQLGLGHERLLHRLLGAVVLTVVLAVPDLRHGVSAPVALAALPAALGVAAVEELLVRGVLFALWQQQMGGTMAVIATSIAFAAMHAGLYPPPVLLLGGGVGLLLGSWRALTGDLVAPIVAHAVADAVAVGVLGGAGMRV